MKRDKAQERYSEDIQLMHHYAKQHEEKFMSVDDEMTLMINEWTDSNDHVSGIKRIWEEKCRQNGRLSQQLWERREAFLRKKKKKIKKKKLKMNPAS